MFHDVPQCIFLYLLDKGAAADEDLDLSKVATPDPVRTIAGSFVGGDKGVAMTAVKNNKGVTTHFETVVEFKSTDEVRSFNVWAGTSNYVTFGCDSEYEFADGAAFATKVNGTNITVPAAVIDEETGEPVAESVYYVVEQSYDGMTITITTPETPDLAQWDFEWEGTPSVFDFGVTFDDLFIFAEYDDYDDLCYNYEFGGVYTYKYEFVPTGITSGNFCFYPDTYSEAPAVLDVLFTYSDYDGNSFVANSDYLGLEDVTVTMATERREVFVDTPAGCQWDVNMMGGQIPAVLDFGLTFENQFFYAFDADAVGAPYSGYYVMLYPALRGYTIVPTSYTTGEIYLTSASMEAATSADASVQPWMTYSGFDGTSFVIESCAELIGQGLIAAKTTTNMVSPRNPCELYIDSPAGKQLLPISYEKKADGSIVKTGYEGVVYDMGYTVPGKIVVAYFEPDECTEAEKEYGIDTITDLVPPTDAIYRVSDYEDPSDPGYDYLLEYDDMYSGSFMFIGKNGKTGEFDEMQILYSDFSKNGYFVYVAFDSETEPMICEVRGYNSSDSFNTPLTLSPDGEAVSEFNIEGEQLWTPNGDVKYVIDLGESFIVAKSADGETWEKVLVADNYEIVASPNPELVAYFVDITSDGVDYSFSFEPGETPLMVNVFEETLIYSEVKSIVEETEEEIIEYFPLSFVYNSDPELRIEL